MFGDLMYGLIPYGAILKVNNIYDIIWRDACSGSLTWTLHEKGIAVNVGC